jgi:hypothetical protein
MSKRLLVRDQRGERERLLVGTMTVGRDTRCDISDADPLLSRRHAEFVCRPDSLVVRDLNSRNGISVNGVKVQEAVLRPGDVVKIARLVLTYLGALDAARSAPTRPGADAGRPRADDDAMARLDAARTERFDPAAGAAPDAPGSDSRDDRTRVVPRRSALYTSPPGQVSVARMTPPAQAAPAPTRSPGPPAELPPPGLPEADSDSTRPMIRDNESKTATPVLPLSALAAAEAVSVRPLPPLAPAVAAPPLPPVARPLAAPPLVAVVRPVSTPPASDLLEDWSLELRPLQVDRPSPRPEAPPRASASPGADASRLAPATSLSSGVRALAGSLLLALVAFALGAVPLLVWRGRIADSYDRVLIVPTALTFGTAIVVFGPPLLVALAAGILLAWWLRRG